MGFAFLSVNAPNSSRHITESRRLAELASPPRRLPGIRRHYASCHLHRPLPEVFAFFADPRNLAAITPPDIGFRILTPEVGMRDGAMLAYRIELHGVVFGWRSRILRWDPPFGFVDEQVSGPYSVWHHIHTFTDEGDRVRMDDEVLYRMPVWPLGEVASPWVKKEVERIFAYRARRIREIFDEL